MTLTDQQGFDQLCALCGVTESYYDIRGVHHVASLDAKLSLLKSLGFTIHSDQDIEQSLELLRLRPWRQIIAPVHVYASSDSGAFISVTLPADQPGRVVEWQIDEDNGQTQLGEWRFEQHDVIEQCEVDGINHYRFHWPLPRVSSIGYHRLKFQLASGVTASSLLVATPDACYQPDSFATEKKVWGISLQLYSLRSKRNWGIGDYTDLGNAIATLAPLGIDVIGLNPLHALFAHLPEQASPYSPSSRNFLNPLYLDIEAIEEFSHCARAQQRVHSARFQKKLQLARDSSLVDYTALWKIKREIFDLLYQQFRQDLQLDDERAEDFRHYQTSAGKDLARFSLFEALQEHFFQQDNAIVNWKQWPLAFQDPKSQSVADWAGQHIERIEFHQYLQWQSEHQLSAVQAKCKQLGMQIGLYNDLAVGDEKSSSSCWAQPAQYALFVGVGAPPDDFNLLGQNWGLPPIKPQALQENAYRLFIKTLQSNMQYAGALRIDHVMGLMRLYWVPDGYAADQGTYLAYPFDDLLGILALESHRNICLVVGEDLGTVSDEVRYKLWNKRILSYRILLFEKNWDQGTFKRPDEYPLHALCTSGSHDLPTLAGYWKASDLRIRDELNLFPSDDIKSQQCRAREQDRYAIKQALHQQQIIPDQLLNEPIQPELSAELLLAAQRYLARSKSLLMMVQLEDILMQEHQINVPGTVNEYPNWRYKIPINLEDWCAQSDIELVAQAINTERKSKHR